MLNKKYRLTKKSAFTATYKVNNACHIGGITLFAGLCKPAGQYGAQDTPTRAGFVVSKKTHKRAVRRNRLKRLMREAYRLLMKSGDLGNSQNHMSLIFIGSEKALDKDFDQVQNIIKKLIERL